MLSLILLALLLPGAMGCCMPSKFFAMRTNAKTGLRSSYVVDYAAKRSAITPNNQPDYPVKTIVNDFKAGVSYVIYKNGACKTAKVNKYLLFHQCMPSNAKLLYSDYLGKNHDLDLHTYAYKYGNVNVQMTISKDGCYPVMRRQDPLKKGLETKAIVFSNVKKLTDRDAKKYCIGISHTVIRMKNLWNQILG